MTAPLPLPTVSQRQNTYGDTYIYGTAPVHMGDAYTIETVASDGIGQDKERTKTAFLHSLSFPELDYRFHNVNDATSNTCYWFLTHELYQEWKKTNSYAISDRILWLRGKPGSGKSTIMKQAVLDTRFKRNVRTGQSARAKVVASFFFNARGSRLESTIQGFFRSVLLQVFEHADLALDEEPLETFVRKHFLTAKGWEWTLAELQAFFRSSVAPLPLDLVLYIDALDECDPATQKDLVDFLYEYVEKMQRSNATLKICISSRHYPNIHRLNCASVVVEEHNSPDIRTYARSKLLSIGCEFVMPQQIVTQSSGIFLWGVIVIGRLRESIENGEPRSRSLQLLSSVPKDLRKLFESLLSSIIENEDRKESLLLLLFVLCAKRPLKLPELNLVLAFTTQYQSQAEYRQSLDYLSNDQLRRLVVKRSRGLIEIVRGPIEYIGLRSSPTPDVVQFVHTSVKDFLLENYDLLLPQVRSGKEMLAVANDQLARSCFNFLKARDVCDHDNVAKVPWSDCRHQVRHGHHALYQYIRQHAFEHAREAELSGISQMHIVESLDLMPLGSRSGNLPYYLSVRLWKSTYFDPMTVFCYYQLLCIFKALPIPISPDLVRALHLDRALIVAVSMGHEAIVNELKSREVGLTPDTRGLVYEAVEYADIHMLEMLLEMGGDPEARGEYGTALNLVAATGKFEHVRALLRYNAKVCVNEPAFGHPLLSASSEGHSRIVEILIDHGASVALRGKYKWGFHGCKTTHALEEASCWNNTSVLEILLRAAAHDCLDEEYYRDAFSAAISARSVDCVRMIRAAVEGRGFGSDSHRRWYSNEIPPPSSKPAPVRRGEITVHVNTVFHKMKSVVLREHSQALLLREACSNQSRWLLGPNKRRIEDEDRLCDINIYNGSMVHEVLPFRARTYWVDDAYATGVALRFSIETYREECRKRQADEAPLD